MLDGLVSEIAPAPRATVPKRLTARRGRRHIRQPLLQGETDGAATTQAADALRLPEEGRSPQRGGGGEAGAATALLPWTDAVQEGRVDPTAGLVRAQQEAWRERLAHDRKMVYREKQTRFTELMQLAAKKREEEVVEVPELPPPVVQEILDAVIADPAREVAALRIARVGESLAVLLEGLLTCSPPASIRASLGLGVGEQLPVRIVEAWPPPEPDLPHLVLLAPKPGSGSPVVWRWRRRLNAAAPTLGAAMARRMMIVAAPELRFDIYRGDSALAIPSSSSRPSLWRIAKRARRMNVHAAMRSFARDTIW